MTKQSRTIIIIMIALAFIITAYTVTAIWQRKDVPVENSAPAEPSVRIGNLSSSRLVRIESPSVTLENRGGKWEVVSLAGKTPVNEIELDQWQTSSLAWLLAGVLAESIVEKEPQDIFVYGFENPSARVTVTDTDGNQAVYIRGDMTPSRLTYYVMEEGDPKVYTVSIKTAGDFDFTIDEIRQRSLFDEIDLQTLNSFRLESQNTNIEIVLKPGVVPSHLLTSSSRHIISSPYRLFRGADDEALHKNVLEHIQNLQIYEFIDDNPASLVPYGLDQPARIYISSITDVQPPANGQQQSLDLLLGNSLNNGLRYAKLASKPGVFTVAGIDRITSIKPFTLVDKFALLVDINDVNRVTVRGGPQFLSAEIRGHEPKSGGGSSAGNDLIFFLNGRQAQDASFRRWYQSVIGLLFDAEIPGAFVQTDGTIITIEYELNIYPGASASMSLIPYNRDFYAVSQSGAAEFLISRNQVNRIWETADSVIFAE